MKAIVWAAAGWLILAAAAEAGGDPVKGRTAAEKWCSRCHVIGLNDPLGGIDMTPWFLTMARKPATYPPRRIRTFGERPPHPPQKIDITDAEMADLIAYIPTLTAK